MDLDLQVEGITSSRRATLVGDQAGQGGIYDYSFFAEELPGLGRFVKCRVCTVRFL